MNDKIDPVDPKAQVKAPEAPAVLGGESMTNAEVFTVKLRVKAPLDHLIAQLYRAWPKLGARRDN